VAPLTLLNYKSSVQVYLEILDFKSQNAQLISV